MPESRGGDLRELRRSAQEALQRLGRIPEHPELDPVRREAERLARHIIDNSDKKVRIGVFGGFSVGKSLLLGTLLGNPRLLPVHNQATTANVAVLRLTQSDGRTAEIRGAQVEYLDQDELTRYLAHLLRTAAEAGQRADVAPQDLALLHGLPPEPRSLPALRGWLHEQAARRPQSSLAPLLAEVAKLQAALELVAPGTGERIDAGGELFELLTQDEGRDGAGGGSRFGLRRAMIRRLLLDVAVPVSAWNLAALHGATVEFVDVPGRGGGEDAARHEFLTALEIAEIDVAMIMVAAERARTTERFSLNDLIYATGRTSEDFADCLFAVISKFDGLQGLPWQLLDDRQQASRLPSPPTEADLFAASGDLRGIFTAARELLPSGRDDRIAVVSPLVHLARAAADPVAGPWAEELAAGLRLRKEVADAGAKADAWRVVGFPAGEVGAMLRAFAEDGGIARLREKLVVHARSRGLEQRYRALARQAAALADHEAELARIQERLGPLEVTERESAARLRAAVEALSAHAADMRAELWSVLGDPRRRPQGGLSLYERIQQDAVYAVADWPMWSILFSSVDGDLVIVRDTEDPWPDDDEEDEEDRLIALPSLPTAAADFLAPYRDTCRSLHRRAADLIVDAVAAWESRWRRAFAEERRIVTETIDDRLRARVEKLPAYDPQTVYIRALFQALDRLLADGGLSERVRRELEKAEPPSDAEIDRTFPFDAARALAWHPRSPRYGRAGYCDLIQVFRLRRELGTAATGHIGRYLGALQQRACQTLDKRLAAIIPRLTWPEGLTELIAEHETDGGETVHA